MHGAHDRKCNESWRAIRQLRPLQAPFGRFSGAVLTIYLLLSSSDLEIYRVESAHHAVFSVSSLNRDTADHWTILYAAGLGAGLTEAVLAVTPTETIKSGKPPESSFGCPDGLRPTEQNLSMMQNVRCHSIAV